MKEQLIVSDFMTRFRELEVGEIMKIPLSKLSPTSIDDFTSSHTPGPIEVYSLKKVVKGQTITKIHIADGNHRYFDQLRYGKKIAREAGINFNPETELVEVKKINPEPENDIRYMFNAKGWFGLNE
jgi:hypothetical protein